MAGSLPGAPFPIVGTTQNEVITSMAADPAGRFLFAASAARLFSFKINGDGTLTPAPAPIPTTSTSVRMIASATVLYVTFGGIIQSFAIQPDASLTLITSTAPDPTHVQESDLALSADGRFLYVADSAATGVRAFDAQTLAPLSGSPFAATASYGQLALDPSGRFLYAAASQGIFGFNVQSDGSITPLDASPLGGIDAEFMRAGTVK